MVMIREFWTDVEDEILGCLACHRALTPGEIAGKLGMSEESATSLVCLLAQEGKVRIHLVAAAQVDVTQ
jgi:DNA-binding transcriptional regulator LsrR (DeoR family)